MLNLTKSTRHGWRPLTANRAQLSVRERLGQYRRKSGLPQIKTRYLLYIDAYFQINWVISLKKKFYSKSQ